MQKLFQIQQLKVLKANEYSTSSFSRWYLKNLVSIGLGVGHQDFPTNFKRKRAET
jgi:hypothetical protein